MRTSHFLIQKTSHFSKFMMCPHGQGGRRFEPVRNRGRGPLFAILCGRLLWTAPYLKTKTLQSNMKSKRRSTYTPQSDASTRTDLPYHSTVLMFSHHTHKVRILGINCHAKITKLEIGPISLH